MNRRLYRCRDDRKISGVCSGLGIYMGMDPTVVRLIWIIVSVCTAFFTGILIYIVCAMIIPEEPDYYEAEYREK